MAVDDSIVIEPYTPQFFQQFGAWGYQARLSSEKIPIIQAHALKVAEKYPVHVYQNHHDIQFWTESTREEADLTIRRTLLTQVQKDSSLKDLPIEDRTLT